MMGVIDHHSEELGYRDREPETDEVTIWCDRIAGWGLIVTILLMIFGPGEWHSWQL